MERAEVERVLSPERLSGIQPVTGVVDLAAIQHAQQALAERDAGAQRGEADLT